MEEHRCTGHCCIGFPLPYSYEEIQAKAKPDGKGKFQDGEIIADMIYPIDWVPHPDEIEPGVDWASYRYGCKHVQPNGDCVIYDKRPTMCKNYPYGRPCYMKGCTYTGSGVSSKIDKKAVAKWVGELEEYGMLKEREMTAQILEQATEEIEQLRRENEELRRYRDHNERMLALFEGGPRHEHVQGMGEDVVRKLRVVAENFRTPLPSEVKLGDKVIKEKEEGTAAEAVSRG